MSAIAEFAKTKNIDLIVNARNKLEENRNQWIESYKYLLLNHIGALLGIRECEFAEIQQYNKNPMLINADSDTILKKMRRLADKGYGKALMYVADSYRNSNPELALKYYMQCLNNSDVDRGEANSQIGLLYYCSDQLETKDGIEYLKTAADKYNNGAAQFGLAVMFLYGEGVEKDEKTSLEYCVRAADNGNADAQSTLGRNYLYASDYNLEQSVPLALSYLKRAAKQYDGDAMYTLGVFYYDGTLVEKDMESAEDYLKDAAYFDVPGANAFLGKIEYDRGDYVSARNHLEIAHDKYNLTICLDALVDIYKNGLGCKPDLKKAIMLIEEMVNQNSAEYKDIEFLADCYYEGKYVEKDIDKAVTYYRHIEDNNPSVKYKLGCIAYEGKSYVLPKSKCIVYLEYAGNNGYPDAFFKIANYYLSINNRDGALEWYKRSFNAGNADAGVMVGRNYEAGTPNITKSLKSAVEWYKLAAEKGSAKAKEELTHIKSGFFGYKRV